MSTHITRCARICARPEGGFGVALLDPEFEFDPIRNIYSPTNRWKQVALIGRYDSEQKAVDLCTRNGFPLLP